jgi:hypothetical protein
MLDIQQQHMGRNVPSGVDVNKHLGRNIPMYSVEPSHKQSNMNGRRASRPRNEELETSLTTVDHLENEYGEGEKAYSRKTPTRKVNLDDYKNVLKRESYNSRSPMNRRSRSISKSPMGAQN